MEWFFLIDVIVLAVLILLVVGSVAYSNEAFRVQLAWFVGLTLFRKLRSKYGEWKNSKRDAVPDIPVDSGNESISDHYEK